MRFWGFDYKEQLTASVELLGQRLANLGLSSGFGCIMGN